MRITSLAKHIGMLGGTLLLALAFAHTPTASAQTTPAASSTDDTAPMFSDISVSTIGDTGATISWMTNASSTSQVAYGTSTPYTTYSEYFPAMTTEHVVTLSNLLPATTYHFQLISMDAEDMIMKSDDHTFSTGTTTNSNDDEEDTDEDMDEDNGNDEDSDGNDNDATYASIEAQIRDLYAQLDRLWTQLQSLDGDDDNNGGNNGTSTPPTTNTGMISPSNATMSAGATVDFNGRYFGNEENIQIKRNGTVIGSAHADGGGNFSTGSMMIPTNATGTQTYTFTGQWSGITGTSVINIR